MEALSLEVIKLFPSIMTFSCCHLIEQIRFEFCFSVSGEQQNAKVIVN